MEIVVYGLWKSDSFFYAFDASPIPPGLGKLGALQDLSLWNNNLSGESSPELKLPLSSFAAEIILGESRNSTVKYFLRK